MKPFGIRAEQRDYEQNYYGGYCNKAREFHLEPMPYVRFQQELRRLLDEGLSRKKRIAALIEVTKKFQTNKEN